MSTRRNVHAIRRDAATGTAPANPGWEERRPAHWFPERQILFRTDGRVRFLTLTTRAQWAIVLVSAGFAGLLGYTILAQMQLQRALAAKDREIGSINTAYIGLKSAMSDSESRFRTVARTLEAKHAYLMALLDRRMASPGPLEAVPAGPGGDDPLRERIESSRRALLAQLGALERVLGESADSVAGQSATRPNWSPRPDSNRARLQRDRKRLVARIESLEERLHVIGGSQREVMNYLAAQSIDDFDRAKKLVALSGLDVDRLLAKIGGRLGQGGPFIAALPDRERPDPALVPPALGVIHRQLDRWEKLGVLIGHLPLVAPTDHYYVASGFGKRRDPVNGRWGMHYGTDMAGVNRSPILATAPGVVVKVGWNGSYGRLIEIDHGLGIRTRYGHLRRILVRRGQKVGFRQKIGQMGSSGRSTGPHVHYEVLVNGKPRDPEKFMKAGEHVLKGF